MPIRPIARFRRNNVTNETVLDFKDGTQLRFAGNLSFKQTLKRPRTRRHMSGDFNEDKRFAQAKSRGGGLKTRRI